MNKSGETPKTAEFLNNIKVVSVDYDPSYMKVFDFEKYDHEKWREWMAQHWQWSVYASVLYVITIFMGQLAMQNRAPFQLRKFLTIWNVTLALFSAAGFLRSAPELMYIVGQPNGFHRSVCFLDDHNIATSLWGLLFALSKIVEFGDTAFVVLRKQPLIFLHWYHHMSVCCFCWFSYDSYDQSNRWFCTMNYFVHALMYSYYTLKILRFKLPKALALTLTCLQLSQMVMGVVINVYTLSVQLNGGDCNRPYSNMHLAFGMYASYFFLFANFFKTAYLQKRKIA